jgi:hypothetical protein
MSTSFPTPSCPECRKLMRSIAKAATRKCKYVADGLDDPLHSPDIWNLLEGELRPPKTAGEQISAKRK